MSTVIISEQLKQYRIINHFTQQQVADYLKIAVSAYNHYESGVRVPSADKLAALARLYKLEDQGYISSHRVMVGKRMTRVYYHLEPAGEALLKQLTQEYEAVTQGVFQIIRGGQEHE